MSEPEKAAEARASAAKKSPVQARQSIQKRRKHQGRPPGVQNVFTKEMKQAFLLAFDGLGGVDALIEWGRKHRTAFYRICARLIPSGGGAHGGVTVNVNNGDRGSLPADVAPGEAYLLMLKQPGNPAAYLEAIRRGGVEAPAERGPVVIEHSPPGGADAVPVGEGIRAEDGD